ncbi:hypothetical protein GCM10010363_76000 [Streptomyces omiyaensis]|nr:hypothetical protein GCM10010363_76000 [Streptomyces omiyaensis]
MGVDMTRWSMVLAVSWSGGAAGVFFRARLRMARVKGSVPAVWGSGLGRQGIRARCEATAVSTVARW